MKKIWIIGMAALLMSGCRAAKQEPCECVCDCDLPEKAEKTAPAEPVPVKNTAAEPIQAGAEAIELPDPVPVSVTLTKALEQRRTVRAFDGRMPSLQDVSNLLWSAYGINRKDGKRTAPSSYNKQSVTLYAAFEQGTYRYDFKAHQLVRTSQTDIRTVKDAPMELIFVSNFKAEGESRDPLYYAATTRGIDAGVVSQNAALYCAAAELATGIRMIMTRGEKAVSALGLKDDDTLLFLMPVGYEKK